MHSYNAPQVPATLRRIALRNEGVAAILGDATLTQQGPPCGTGGRGPCWYGGWIIDWNSHQPAMPETAIRHAPIPNIKNVAYDSECRPLLLDLRSESQAVV